jgi:hypothetical protein
MVTILPGSSLRKTDKNKFFGHLTSGRVSKWPLQMATTFPRCFLTKTEIFGHFWLQGGPRVATSTSLKHHYYSKQRKMITEQANDSLENKGAGFI